MKKKYYIDDIEVNKFVFYSIKYSSLTAIWAIICAFISILIG